jgi:hypothetical protein
MDIKNIHEQVNATLDSIDTLSRAEIPPFFYTRLQARLDKQQVPTWWQLLFMSLTKPAFAVVTLSLFVVLNITAITITLKDKQQSNTTSESTTMQGFAQEYNLSVSTVYTDKTDRK